MPIADCICTDEDVVAEGDGIVRVQNDRKRRKGKGATVISGAPVRPSELSVLAKTLKKKCGSGGTAKDGIIEIQGDQRDTVIAVLEERGWTVKRVGG